MKVDSTFLYLVHGNKDRLDKANVHLFLQFLTNTTKISPTKLTLVVYKNKILRKIF
jgi:hypothetical protein